jgi:hypothetical protein
LVSRPEVKVYGRSNQGLFEVLKPLTGQLVGVGDTFLTAEEEMSFDGNDLGKLGNSSFLPTPKKIFASVGY